MHGVELVRLLGNLGIEVKSLKENGREWILLYCSRDPLLNSVIRKYNGGWHGKLKCWYLRRNKRVLLQILKDIAAAREIDIEHPAVVQVKRMARLKGYSANTERIYAQGLQQWIDHFYPADPEMISKEDTENWLLELVYGKGLQESSIHSLINAIRFYFEAVLGKPTDYYMVQRPIKPLKIPAVFSKEEVKRIL